MGAAMVHIIALTCTAAMLAAVMLVAWRSFGRPQPALVWALAFAVATLEWAAHIAMRLGPGDEGLPYALVAGLACFSNALIAIGFYQRSGAQAGTASLLLAAAGAALVLALITFVIPHRGFRDTIWLFFSALMLVISATNVTRSLRHANLPERATISMLVLFAAVYFGNAVVTLSRGVSNHGDGFELLRTLLMLLYPVAFIGVGIFSVFLVAADFAETLRRQATSDELTGLYNRRGFEDAAEREIRNAQRQRRSLAVVVADLDNFKAINDRHGHTAGDRALKHFAGRLGGLLRRGDLIGRIGGEEFAALLVDTRAQDAVEVVERIRRDIAAMPVEGAARIEMTASFGVTGLRPGDISLAALFSRADRALYRSKLDGRDRVTSAEDLDETI
jgi:diguanylate cyclase (GGDEF)-like protein